MPRTPGRRTRSVSSYRAPRVRVGMNPLCEEQGTAVASDSGPERCVHHLHPEERSNGIQRKVPLPSVARGEQDARAGCPNNSLVRTRVRAVTLKLPDGRGGTKPKKKREKKARRPLQDPYSAARTSSQLSAPSSGRRVNPAVSTIFGETSIGSLPGLLFRSCIAPGISDREQPTVPLRFPRITQ